MLTSKNTHANLHQGELGHALLGEHPVLQHAALAHNKEVIRRHSCNGVSIRGKNETTTTMGEGNAPSAEERNSFTLSTVASLASSTRCRDWHETKICIYQVV